MWAYWSRTCRSSKKTIEEYHKSKNIETNNTEGLSDNTDLKLDDFFEDYDGNLFNNENLNAIFEEMTEPTNK